MSSAIHNSYRDNAPGFYVINPHTNIAVAGPYESKGQAATVCHDIDHDGRPLAGLCVREVESEGE